MTKRDIVKELVRRGKLELAQEVISLYQGNVSDDDLKAFIKEKGDDIVDFEPVNLALEEYYESDIAEKWIGKLKDDKKLSILKEIILYDQDRFEKVFMSLLEQDDKLRKLFIDDIFKKEIEESWKDDLFEKDRNIIIKNIIAKDYPTDKEFNDLFLKNRDLREALEEAYKKSR